MEPTCRKPKSIAVRGIGMRTTHDERNGTMTYDVQECSAHSVRSSYPRWICLLNPELCLFRDRYMVESVGHVQSHLQQPRVFLAAVQLPWPAHEHTHKVLGQAAIVSLASCILPSRGSSGETTPLLRRHDHPIVYISIIEPPLQWPVLAKACSDALMTLGALTVG